MARLEVNRSGEMEVFVKVVEQGGFSAAARAFRMTPSAVSKLVARLEARLGARLFNRSTRRLQLTPEGCAFFERSVRLLADLDEAERCAGASETPAGRLRVNVSVPVGMHVLLPLMPEFLERHPGVSLDIDLTDQVVDLLEERTDIAIRSGPLKSSRMVARKLGETRMTIVGAPSYLRRRGVPGSLKDLESHDRLGFGYVRAVEGWPLMDGDRRIVVPTIGSARVSNGDALRALAVDGMGLARLAAFLVEADIAAGRLKPVLDEFNPGDMEEIHAVYLGQGGLMSARVRAFLDFLAERVRIG